MLMYSALLLKTNSFLNLLKLHYSPIKLIPWVFDVWPCTLMYVTLYALDFFHYVLNKVMRVEIPYIIHAYQSLHTYLCLATVHVSG